MSDTPESTMSVGGQGELTILNDPHREMSDLKLLHRAVRRRWPVREKKAIVKRLLEIMDKRQVIVITRTGPVMADAPADSNAIAAARVLALMEGQNQSDEHHFEGQTVRHEHSLTIDQRRTRLVEIIAAASDRIGAGGSGDAVKSNGNGKHNGHAADGAAS